ncbi:aminotransferase class I/II-fold pyridoxal phosphate-dependent enzyme [Streptomyces olivaceiscleroticus]|uniref:Aminotransferase class I/II-fold pyridoxal phosphate-dependent enzyme n=1 Tax=Streptomyces olivaceiscleroticus TaxID=68245 RepID=A0ABN1AJ10_9ACTN
MQPSAPEPQPDPDPPMGLPVLPELAAHLAAAAGRTAPEPPGGALALRTAACGYFERRGLWSTPGRVLAGPGAPALLLALLAAAGGDLVVPRPCAAWYAPQARLLGRAVHPAPVPVESGGVPDPFTLLEAVHRARDAGGDPRVLLLSVADDPTGTCPPPEQLHEVCEAATGEGLWIVSDETRRDLLHDPHDTVVLSPAEMLPGSVVVLADLRVTLVPASWPAGLARFPDTGPGEALCAAVLAALSGLSSPLPGPLAAAVGHALTEPATVRERTAAAALLHGRLAAGLHRTVTEAGAVCRPPHAGNHLYADLEPLRPAFAARGVTGPVALEQALAPWAARGGHRFGDDPKALRVRLSTEALLAPEADRRRRLLAAPDPLEVPSVAESLAELAAVLRSGGGSAAGG